MVLYFGIYFLSKETKNIETYIKNSDKYPDIILKESLNNKMVNGFRADHLRYQGFYNTDIAPDLNFQMFKIASGRSTLYETFFDGKM